MQLIDTRLARNNQIIRKGIAFASEVPRAFTRMAASNADFERGPPIIADSIPKSGTHLLLQIARAIPGTRYYGSFLSWATSRRLVAHSQEQMDRRIARIVPNEVVPAHIRHSAASADKLRSINAIHLMIVRDPRDVALSEAEYIAFMNPWHHVHRYVKDIADPNERIRLMIEGIPEAGGLFPDLGQRLRPYANWLDEPDVTVIRYEELRGAGLDDALERIAAAVAKHRHLDQDVVRGLPAVMKQRIDPNSSHTFRSGKTERWRTELTPENKKKLYDVASDVITRLGYTL